MFTVYSQKRAQMFTAARTAKVQAPHEPSTRLLVQHARGARFAFVIFALILTLALHGIVHDLSHNSVGPLTGIEIMFGAPLVLLGVFYYTAWELFVAFWYMLIILVVWQ